MVAVLPEVGHTATLLEPLRGEGVMEKNRLYFGDNLDWLQDRQHFPDEFVNLIYLDPPFNSRADYNKIFREPGGQASMAQARAFDDTWDWSGSGSERAFRLIADSRYGELARFIEWLGADRQPPFLRNMAAYLSMMGARLIELRRVLHPQGSIYLHCDQTAVHYLKVVMDAIFGIQNFRGQIIWKRTTAHSDTKQGSKQPGRIHDVLLFYTKSAKWTWNPIHVKHDPEYLKGKYRFAEPGTERLYRKDNLTARKPGGDTLYEWRVKRPFGSKQWVADLEDEWRTPQQNWEYKGVPPYKNRFWAYSRENMLNFEQQGLLVYTRSGMPEYKRFPGPGVSLQDIWTDIALNSQADERLGYPTQKPEELLERIILSSSNEDDIILDPFCGCGTTLAVALRPSIKRKWIGIDVTYLAIDEVERRFQNQKEKPPDVRNTYDVYGRPFDEASAWKLAKKHNKQFELWAVSIVGAHPRDRDGGADGIITLVEGARRQTAKVIVQVKGKENVVPGDVRELMGTVDKEKAVMGLFITLASPTQEMKELAVHSGRYLSPQTGQNYQRIQILTVKELVEPPRKKFDLPPSMRPGD